ncbi:glucose 1-dehydrogenase [Candidatus Bathyarchaeota archaeon]|nr:glucose 1-dehydrogenase [Candidatus Bathyarchaeota archaeon]
MKLEDKVALVTGAGIGIGKAIALELAKKGADVAVNYLKSEKGALEVVNEIKKSGRDAFAIRADVTDETQVKNMIQETVGKLGRLDILVNNAGVIERTPLEDIKIEEWDRVMDINLRGPFLCTLYAGRHMIENGGGNIVNISSIAALNPDIYMGAYSVSKAALNMFSEVTAVEWAGYNIRVNSVCPGPVETDMIKKAFNTPELLEARLKAIPNHRMSQPEDIAKVVSFLASDDASNITGEHIIVDGASSRSMYFLINQLSK